MELVWFLKYINNEIVWCGVEIELAWRGNRQQLILATARVQFTAEKAIVREVRGDEYRESESEGTRRERSQREPVVAADPGTGCGELSCAKLNPNGSGSHASS